MNVAFEFSILEFSTNFVLLELTCLVTLFDWKLQTFKNFPKLTFSSFFINFCPFKLLYNYHHFSRYVILLRHVWSFLNNVLSPFQNLRRFCPFNSKLSFSSVLSLFFPIFSKLSFLSFFTFFQLKK